MAQLPTHPRSRETVDRIFRRSSYNVEPLLPLIYPVRTKEVNVYPAPRWLTMMWKSEIAGMTHWRWIFVRPALFDGNSDDLARLVIHELVHVSQFAKVGYFSFLFRYVMDYLGGRVSGMNHRDAYRAISFEMEARMITSDVTAI